MPFKGLLKKTLHKLIISEVELIKILLFEGAQAKDSF